MKSNVLSQAHVLESSIERLSDELRILTTRVASIEKRSLDISRLAALFELSELVKRGGLGTVCPPDTWSFRPEHVVLQATNLHACEYSHVGEAMRWTGPENDSHFRVFVRRDIPMTIRVRVVATLGTFEPRDVVLRIDGKEMVSDWDGDHLVAKVPPRDDDFFSVTSLVLVTPSASAPADLGIGTDTRRIGFALGRIDVE